VTRRELAARRQLLAANATLQRVRLAHDASALRTTLRPPGWAGVALTAAALVAIWSARRSTRRGLPFWRALWALRGLAR
jgi:hypothetical protein